MCLHVVSAHLSDHASAGDSPAFPSVGVASTEEPVVDGGRLLPSACPAAFHVSAETTQDHSLCVLVGSVKDDAPGRGGGGELSIAAVLGESVLGDLVDTEKVAIDLGSAVAATAASGSPAPGAPEGQQCAKEKCLAEKSLVIGHRVRALHGFSVSAFAVSAGPTGSRIVAVP